MTVFIFIEHINKYYDNMGGAFNMINIGNSLKKKGIDTKIIIQNCILNQNVLEENKYYKDILKIFSDISVIDCTKVDIRDFYTKINITANDIVIATLKQYIDLFQDITKNIIIYVHGGGENHMKYLSPLLDTHLIAQHYPVIFYDKYWFSTSKIKSNVQIDVKNVVFPYFSVHPDLLPTAQKCCISNKKDRKCQYIQKNKYKLKYIHNENQDFDLNDNSQTQNIRILNKTKFMFGYDIHSLYINFAILLRNNIIIPKYKNMSKDEFLDFYKKDSKRQNDEFFVLLKKYLHYVEDEKDLDNLQYIEIKESTEYLFDELINKFHTANFKSYKDMNDDTIDRLIQLFNNIDGEEYLRVSMIE